MRAINESTLQNCLDSGSTKRLQSYRRRLSRDDYRRIIDTKAVEVLKKYSNNLQLIDSTLDYLASLTDSNGVPFARSIRTYDGILDSMAGFYEETRPSFLWNRHCQAACETVGKRYAKAELRALTYTTDQDVIDAVTDWTTSAGWEAILRPDVSKKQDLLNGDHQGVSSGILDQLKLVTGKALADGSFNKPIILATRTQCSGAFTDEGRMTGSCKHKTRAVDMVDAFVVMAERRFSKPLTDWLVSYPYSAIGKSDEMIARRTISLRLRYPMYLSLDYSKYDSTLPAWLIHAAFIVVKQAFPHLTNEEEQLLTVLEEDFTDKNFILADGVRHASHGTPSGSSFTSIINGICNEIMTETWLNYYGWKGEYQIMGDDNLVYVQANVRDKLEEIASYIRHNFGIKVNADKSSVGYRDEDPEYLSRVWTLDGPSRDAGTIISLLAYPERWRDYRTQLSPEIVVFSYILAYAAAMRKLMNVDQFLTDTRLSVEHLDWTKELLREVPYNVRVWHELREDPRTTEQLKGAA